MKAWLLDSLEGIDKLRLADAPDPQPQPAEVLLRIIHAALNPADRYLAESQYPAHPSLPHILGRDGAGTVVRLGEEVTGFSIGQRIAILRSEIGVNRPGTFAELVAVPVESLVSIPEGWNDAEAAAAPLVYLTAWQAITQWGELPPSLILITGASGGVGSAAIHLAKAMGHQAIALSRSAEKRQRLIQFGAALALDAGDSDWRKQLKDSLGGRGIDLAIDNIGGSLLPEVIDTLAMHGKVSLVGRLAGSVPRFNTASLFFRRIRLGGVAVGTYTPAETQRVWPQIVALLDRIAARPIIDSIFPFEHLPEAFDRLAAGPMGKVLLRAP